MRRMNRQPTHPGELLGETIRDAGMTQAEFAEKIGVSLQTVNTLINGKRSMTADMAVKLAHAFDTSPELWMGMQTSLDLWKAERAYREEHAR